MGDRRGCWRPMDGPLSAAPVYTAHSTISHLRVAASVDRVCMSNFSPVRAGREIWPSGQRIERHRHDGAYVAVVLSGGYEEYGNRGCLRVAAGDVLLHRAFDAHLNRFPRSGAVILNLTDPAPLPAVAMGRIADPDAIARTAERDSRAALALLREQLQPLERAPADWTEELARHLLADPQCCLGSWAKAHGLRPETVARGFRRVFGVTPAVFRAEGRAHRAFGMIVGTDAPLAAVAASAGFADQAHMTRAIRALTGVPPGVWRMSNSFKTAGTRAG